MRHSFQFASDNTAGICPEAWAALAEANEGSTPSYGEDPWTARLAEQVREIFETDCETFLVFNGTAANALGLAQICRSYHSIICHERAHIATDECGAPEFFASGAKLIPVGGANGKIDLEAVAEVLTLHRDVHATKIRALSLTQSTEAGTVYAPDELEAVASFATEHGLLLHMDGARLANAIASLGCRPRAISWERGVKVLSLGGTKNGIAAGELVIFFDRTLAQEFDYRAKQGAQLASKMRFLAAPWSALLSNDVWLKNARHANEMARQLEDGIRGTGIRLAFPREANALFLHLPDDIVKRLETRAWHFHKFIEPDIYRLMCAWSTTAEEVTALAADFVS